MRFAALMPVLALVLLTGSAGASTLTIVVRPPATTPADATLWLSGDLPELGNWSGAGLRLSRRPDGTHAGSLVLPPGTPFEYKVTRGGWTTVEKAANGAEIANRRAQAPAAGDTLRITVAAWRDQTEAPVERPSTLTGDVRRHERFPSAHVPPRDVLVWLPPGHDADSTRRLPVIYFHDGQNVFDGATSFLPGREWRADETADRLVRSGAVPPFIIVAVANTPARMSEYTSASDARHGGGGSGAYFRFLDEELRPFIERTYRTRTDAAGNGVVGSSLGGLAALELGLSRPDRFGLVGCMSPSVGWSDSAIMRRVRREPHTPLRIWLDMGTEEGGAATDGVREPVRQARALRDALVSRGWREGADLHYEEVSGAAHHEDAWSARLDRILTWLLAAR